MPEWSAVRLRSVLELKSLASSTLSGTVADLERDLLDTGVAERVLLPSRSAISSGVLLSCGKYLLSLRIRYETKRPGETRGDFTQPRSVLPVGSASALVDFGNPGPPKWEPKSQFSHQKSRPPPQPKRVH